MSLRRQPRTVCSLVALVVGLMGLGVVPQAAWLERWDRGVVASWLGLDGERQVAGDGSHERGRYQVEVVGKTEPGVVRVVAVDDDGEGFFEASPPPPADMGVVAMNLKKLGVRHLGYPQSLSWPEPDPIALLGLRKFWDGMDSVSFGYALAYGLGGDPVASPFLRMSIPVKRVVGEIENLPVVNRLAVPEAELGGERSVAGFSVLLNERQEGEWEPLLARWGDRVVFSFVLVSELAVSGVEVDEVTVVLGEEIRLGKAGKRIPIDRKGRVLRDGRGKVMAVSAAMVASELDRELPKGFEVLEGPVWVTDQRSVLGASDEVKWRDRLGGLYGTLDLAPMRRTVKIFRRPDALLELGLMSVWSLALGWWVGAGRRWVGLVKAALAWAVVWQGGVMLVQAGWVSLPFAWLTVPVVVALVRLFLAGPVRGEKVKGEVVSVGEKVMEPMERVVDSGGGRQEEGVVEVPVKKGVAKKGAKKAMKKGAKKGGKRRGGD